MLTNIMSDAMSHDLIVDRMVCDNRNMLMLSFVASDAVTKSVISLLADVKKPIQISCDNAKFARDSSGYRVSKHKLPKFNSYHVIAVAKQPGLVFGDSSRSVSSYLKSSHIDTPLLPEWMEIISKSAIERGLVKKLECFRTEAYLCAFGSEEADELVGDLLKSGKLEIPRKSKHDSNVSS